MRNCPFALVALFVSTLAAAPFATAAAAPPRVLRTIPGDVDTDVDPALTQITVVFDQDMTKGGNSFCGGGPMFPTITAKPTWTDARTCVLPVKLEPGHSYSLSLNCLAAQNFRSLTDEPAPATPLRFRTAARGAASTPVSAEQNAQSLAALAEAIDKQYSYRDRLGLDWPALLKSAGAGVEGKGAFVRAILPVLARAQDPHISVVVDDLRLGTYAPQIFANADLAILAKLVPGWRRQNDYVYTGHYDDGIGYICILSWPGDSSLLAPAQAAIDEMADAPGIILDVRLNGGGDEVTARTIASRFLDAAATYSKSRFRNADDPTGFGTPIDRVIEPAPEAKRYLKPIAVLQGQSCMSSNESFLLMMSRSPRATRLGATSYGSSGNPRPHKLPNGVIVNLPSWQDLTPEGNPIEGVGIAPDIALEPIHPRPTTSDPVLDAALRKLRKQP